MRWPGAVAAVLVGCVLAAACGGATRKSTVALDVGSDARRAGAGADDATQGASLVNQFALDLMRLELGLAAGNEAVSPWSIATALGMVLAGARGNTQAEIAKVLHASGPAAADQGLNGLAQILATRNGSFPTGRPGQRQIVELEAANRLFAQQGVNFAADFLQELAASYGASVGLADFKNAAEAARFQINQWVANQTHGRISDLLPPGVVDNLTRLVLVNAVYLRADWALPFDVSQTKPGRFHGPDGDTTVPFMHATRKWRYVKGNGWQGLDLDYAGGQLAMTILVPDAGRFDEVVRSLGAAVLDGLAHSQLTEVTLALPRFAIGQGQSLRQMLSELGMPTAFTDDADFSGMTSRKELKVKDVLHQANVSVDERGTVAAAATAAIMMPLSGLDRSANLVVDRPFVFLIRDLPTNAILFAGQVTRPSG